MMKQFSYSRTINRKAVSYKTTALERRTPCLARSFLILFAVVVASCTKNGISPDSLEEAINRELRPGDSVADVINFLDKRRIEQFGYKHGEEPFFEQPKPAIRRYVVGKIKHWRSGLLTTWDLYIIFYFDENDRLNEHIIREIGTGP